MWLLRQGLGLKRLQLLLLLLLLLLLVRRGESLRRRNRQGRRLAERGGLAGEQSSK